MSEAGARHVSGNVADVPDFMLGTWRIQPGLNRALRDGVTIQLRPQLMDVLVCLATRPGHVVSREEVLATVWAGEHVVETALARCVAELRAAFGDQAHRPVLIETVYRRGYRIIAPVGRAADARATTEGAPAPGLVASAETPRPEGRFTLVATAMAVIAILLLAWAVAARAGAGVDWLRAAAN
jgi:DNA-binding winged helix-turn-helix (wHTH) protein